MQKGLRARSCLISLMDSGMGFGGCHGRGFTGLAGPALLHDEDWCARLSLKGPQKHEIHVRDIPSPATVRTLKLGYWLPANLRATPAPCGAGHCQQGGARFRPLSHQPYPLHWLRNYPEVLPDDLSSSLQQGSQQFLRFK